MKSEELPPSPRDCMDIIDRVEHLAYEVNNNVRKQNYQYDFEYVQRLQNRIRSIKGWYSIVSEWNEEEKVISRIDLLWKTHDVINDTKAIFKPIITESWLVQSAYIILTDYEKEIRKFL